LLTLPKLTDKIVRALEPPARSNRITYDSEIGGFGVRVTAGGAVAFVLNYRRTADGLERRYTIGAFPDWSVAAARERARALKRSIDSGGDPVGEVRATREAPTVADLCARVAEEHMSKKSRGWRSDFASIVRDDVMPALGRMKVASVEFEHIERLHRDVSKRAPVRANRMHGMLTKAFGLAIKWKLRADNPCRGVERNQEYQRQRYLTADELSRLTRALAEHPDQQVADMIRLLLLTGARRGEVLGARWDEFDLKAGVWTKPAQMTKQRREHRIPLNAPVRQLLARLHARSNGSPWLFPGRGDQHRTDLKYPWRHICKAAGISGLRIHDLRHSYASTLAGAGFSLPVIGALLGHTLPSTTARYAHLIDDPLRRATERAGAILGQAETQQTTHQVQPTRAHTRPDGLAARRSVAISRV
jgi:integrase